MNERLWVERLDRWGWWFLPIAGIGAVVLFGWALATRLPPSSTPVVDDGTVVRVCWGGTLVVRKGDSWFVVRPDSWRGWRAVSDKVCEP